MGVTRRDPRYEFTPEAIEAAVRGAAPRPMIVELHLTGVCQLACGYCHSLQTNDATVYEKGTADYLAGSDWSEIVQQFATLGATDIVISGGGEPTLHRDFVSVVASAAACGVRVHVYTNGMPSAAFGNEKLDVWLPCCASVRVSLHVGSFDRPRTPVDVLHLLLSRRAALVCSTVVSVAILADTWRREAFDDLVRWLAGTAPDLIELRSVIPPLPASGVTVSEAAAALATLLPTTPIDTRLFEDGAKSPPACFSAYRSVIVDPYGGVRLCCMRAHLPVTDEAYVGDLRVESVSSVLARAPVAMSRVGYPVCNVCAYRDGEFNRQAASLVRR